MLPKFSILSLLLDLLLDFQKSRNQKTFKDIYRNFTKNIISFSSQLGHANQCARRADQCFLLFFHGPFSFLSGSSIIHHVISSIIHHVSSSIIVHHHPSSIMYHNPSSVHNHRLSSSIIVHNHRPSLSILVHNHRPSLPIIRPFLPAVSVCFVIFSFFSQHT